MKNIKSYLFLIPSAIILLVAIVGIKANPITVNKIVWDKVETTTAQIVKAVETKDKTEKRDNSSTRRQDNASLVDVLNTCDANVKGVPADGTFTGIGQVDQFGYSISIDVTFRDQKAVSITNMQLINNTDSANVSFCEEAFKPMVKQLLTDKSDVDTVSGATYSSNGIIEAFKDAYSQAVSQNDGTTDSTKARATYCSAKAKSSSADTKTKAKKITSKKTKTTGTVKDGEYKVTVKCNPLSNKQFKAYNLTGTVVFKDGKLSEIKDISCDAPSNDRYIERAIKGDGTTDGVVDQLILKQSDSGINAVSGATCSSVAIRDLYLKALKLATGVKNAEETEAQTDETADNSKEDTLNNNTADNTSDNTTSDDALIGGIIDGGLTDGGLTLPIFTGTLPGTSTTFTGNAYVYAIDYDGWYDFDDYLLRASFSVVNKKVVGINILDCNDISNEYYCNLAINGTSSSKGILEQINSGSQSIDAVSGATCSSKALIEIYENIKDQIEADQ